MFNNHFNKILNELFRFNDFSFENDWEKRTYKSDDGMISFTYITNKKEKLCRLPDFPHIHSERQMRKKNS